MNRNMENLFLL